MAVKNDPAKEAGEFEFVITRVFDAPRDLVFKMWTSAEHLEHWFGPKGSTLHKAKLDVRREADFSPAYVPPTGAICG